MMLLVIVETHQYCAQQTIVVMTKVPLTKALTAAAAQLR